MKKSINEWWKKQRERQFMQCNAHNQLMIFAIRERSEFFRWKKNEAQSENLWKDGKLLTNSKMSHGCDFYVFFIFFRCSFDVHTLWSQIVFCSTVFFTQIVPDWFNLVDLYLAYRMVVDIWVNIFNRLFPVQIRPLMSVCMYF